MHCLCQMHQQLLFLHSVIDLSRNKHHNFKVPLHYTREKSLRVPSRWKANLQWDSKFKDLPGASNYVVDDNSIPQSHQSLHETLYSRGEEEHLAPNSSQQLQFRSDGSEMFPVDLLLTKAKNEKIGAVYAVYDNDYNIQFIGISRDVCFSLKAHREALSEKDVAWVKLKTWDFPKRKEMEQFQEEWITELGFRPPGNVASSKESQLWAKSIREAAQFVSNDTEPERMSVYEEKKFKLRKAMADPSLIDEESREIFERDPTIQAVTEGDWSQVIKQQTSQVAQNTVTSPFESVDVASKDGLNGVSDSRVAENLIPVTVENVHHALDEVRPYLEADGGNVKVLSVDAERNVVLLLQGACGSCPSSTATMKLGIERILRQRFPNIGEITAQSDVSSNTRTPLKERCEKVIEEIKPAIVGLGGSISINLVEDNRVFILYQGPDKIKSGVEMALKEKLSPQEEVVFE